MVTRLQLSGKRFGRWTVIRDAGNNHEGSSMWLCKCDCGNERVVRGAKLTTNWSKSCGCLTHENPSLRIRPYECLYNIIVSNSKALNREIDLSYDDFLIFTKSDFCHYCYSGVFWSEYNVTKFGRAYNLDRVDNELGYSKENLVVCCPRCNWGKGDHYSYEEWYGMTAYFRDKQNRSVVDGSCILVSSRTHKEIGGQYVPTQS